MTLEGPRLLVPIGIFVATYAAIALRNVRGSGIPVWSILLTGAAGMVLSGSISVANAYRAVNLEVIVFLFSMFAIVTALDISGALEAFTTKLLLRAKKPEDILYLTFFGFALASAVLMNDTLALMGTPVMLSLAKKMKIPSRPLLLTLAFSVTIGSVMTPMGNPQNLLIALVSGMPTPVLTFTYYLLAPTAINLVATYVVVRLLFHRDLVKARPGFTELIAFEAALANNRVRDRPLARLTVAIVALTFGAIIFVNTLEAVGLKQPFGISEVSLFGAALLLAVTGRRREVVKALDWGILLLFASLFVLMQALWDTGIVALIAQYLPALSKANPPASLLAILLSSVLLSQVLSNVPMVALYLPLMQSLTYGSSAIYAWAALAGGSTLAGNLTLLGAASNLIIVEEAERQGHTLSFLDFFKVGAVIAAINLAVLYVSLSFMI